MSDLLIQYEAVRKGIGLIDRSKTGKIAVTGKDRFTWLQGMVSNDLKRVEQTGTGHLLACVLDPTGHVLTDLAVVPMGIVPGNVKLSELLGLPQGEFLLIDLPRRNLEKILELFDRYIIMEEVEVKDVTESLGCFSYQGPAADRGWKLNFPKASDPLGKVRAEGERDFDYHRDTVMVPANHTGSPGFDAYFPIAHTQELRQAAQDVGVTEIGLDVQEILRVEAGIPLYGVDMDETTLAPEANLMPTHISLTKGCYVGQEIVARIDSRGHTNRALTGLVFAAGDAPAAGDRIFATSTEDTAERETGRITSFVESAPACQGRPIALGYVRNEHRTPGTMVRVGEARRSAEVRELPFIGTGGTPD